MAKSPIVVLKIPVKQIITIQAILPLALIALFSGKALAGSVTESELWKLCPPEPADAEWRPPSVKAVPEPGTTVIEANEMEVSEEGETILSGKVEVQHDSETIYANHAIYDETRSKVEVRGNVRFWTEGLYWHGNRAILDREQSLSIFEKGDYQLLNKRGHGRAEEIIDKPALDITRLKNVDYTTCPDGPGDKAVWRLKAKDLKLDHDSNWGRALHSILKIRGIPVLYVPYLTFPLTDERMTGFLPMTIGATKDSGFDIRTPFYWNIAPDKDATFTPRILGDRGFMFGSQFRYLRPTGKGILELEYLPYDNRFNGDDRYLARAQITESFGNHHGLISIDFNQISDQEYFEDLGTNIDVTSQRLLDRRADVIWNGGWWSLLSRIQTYQVIDKSLLPEQHPYDRMPQFYFRTLFPQRNQHLNFQLSAETVYFDRETGITGGRFDLMPELNYPIRKAAGFFIPRLKLRHTRYLLNRDDGLDDTPDRTLPILSLDSGVFFERDFDFGGKSFLHTLEPRLFYLYIPETDQSEIPIFDTGEYDTSFAQLFTDDRFNAADRVGDANQLTVALTSRLINKQTGRERMSLSIGQTQYFRDREVTLPGRPVETTSSSDIVALASWYPNDDWTARYDIQWDPHKNQTNKASLNIRYQPQRNAVLNLAYRMRKDLTDIEQVDASIRWPINPNWSVVGRLNYSLQNDRMIESLFGFEYNSCCWATRLVGRRFIRNTEGDFDNAVFFQFELKGLGGFGRGTRDFLQRNIPGYHQEF